MRVSVSGDFTETARFEKERIAAAQTATEAENLRVSAEKLQKEQEERDAILEEARLENERKNAEEEAVAEQDRLRREEDAIARLRRHKRLSASNFDGMEKIDECKS